MLCYVFMICLLHSCSDPRLKVFGERKVNQLRAWFDNRLEEAIKAAEEDSKISTAEQGKTCILLFTLHSVWLGKVVRFAFHSSCFSLRSWVYTFSPSCAFKVLCLLHLHRTQPWTEIVVSCSR